MNVATPTANPARGGRHIRLSRLFGGIGSSALALLPFVMLFAFVFVLPTIYFFRYAASPTAWVKALGEPGLVAVLGRTMLISAEVTVLCSMLGYVYAVGMVRAGRRLRMVLLAALVVPFLSGDLIRTYAWLITLGQSGPINAGLETLFGDAGRVQLLYTRPGLLIGMVNVLLPVFVLPTFAILAGVPPSLNGAARTLGANRIEAFLSVEVPLSMPGAGAGALLVFISALGFYVTPSLLGGSGDSMLAQRIDVEVSRLLSLPAAAVLAATLAGIVGACLVLFRAVYPLELLFVRTSTAPQRSTAGGDAAPGARTLANARAGMRQRLQPLIVVLSRVPFGRLAVLGGIGLAIYLIFPLVVILPVSFSGEDFLRFPPQTFSTRWYESVIGDPQWRLAFGNSILVAAIATTIAVAAGLPLALAIVRGRLSGRLRAGLMALAALPAVTPIIVYAIGIYVWYLTFHLVGNRVAIGAAHAILALPYVLFIVMASLRDLDIRYEQAARSLGAGPWMTFRRITIPLIARSFISGAMFAFLVSFNEFLVARSIASLDTTTLPIKLWTGAREEISPALAAVAALGVGLSLAAGLVGMVIARFRSRAQ